MHHPIALGLTALALLAVPGAAHAASRTFDVAPFTAIDISSGIKAVVTVGGDQSVVADSANQQYLDELKLEVRGDTLHAWIDWDIFDIFEFDREVSITISVPALTEAEASAGADVDVTGMTGQSISLEASAGARLDVRGVAAERFDIDASAGATVDVDGTCGQSSVDSSAGAQVRADRLLCEEVDANASAGAGADVHASLSVRANASAGANIRVYGNPGQIDQETSAGGGVDIRN